MKYRPEIDGLRAFAVLGVVLYHVGFSWTGSQLLTGGYIGVDVFFVVSGYLITSILLAAESQQRFSLAHFYERRVRLHNSGRRLS